MNLIYGNPKEFKKKKVIPKPKKENIEIIESFIDLCLDNEPKEFIETRKYDSKIVKGLKIGLCTKETYHKLCESYDRDKLKELGFYSGKEGKYIPIYLDRIIFSYGTQYFSARSQKPKENHNYKNLFPSSDFFGGKKPYFIHGDNDTLIICEGETDSLALKHIFPYNSIIGIGGVGEYKNIINNIETLDYIKKIIVCFDNDEPGIETKNKFLPLLNNIKYEVLELNFNQSFKDIDDLFREYQEKTKEEIKIEKYRNKELESETIDARSLIESDIPDTEWLIEDLLVKGGTTVIGGDSGAGKSLLSLNISMHLANGKTLFDSFKCEKTDVLYIDEENIPNTIKTRLTQLSKTREITENLDKITFSIMQDMKLDTAQGKRKLGKEKFLNLLNTYKPKVCIIDSLVRFFCGDENSSNDVKEIFDTLKFCTKNFGTSFIILHHTTKMNGGTSRKHTLRGSGDLSAFADIVLILNKITNTNLVGIYQEKNRHQEPIKPFNMIIDQIDGNLNVCYGGTKAVEFETVTAQAEQEIISLIKENDWLEIKTSQIKPRVIKKGFTGYAYNQAIKSMISQTWLSEGSKKGEYKVNTSFREVCDYD